MLYDAKMCFKLLLSKVKEESLLKKNLYYSKKTINLLASQPKGFFYSTLLKIIIMETLNNQQNSNLIEDVQTEAAKQNEELYLTGQESLLFKMYDLEEEDLFV